jgi:Nitronate monooxygenase
MEAAQARNRCQLIDRKILFQVRLYVVQHAVQPALIKTFLREDPQRLRRCSAEVVLHQPRRKTGSESLGKQPAGRGRGLQFRCNCISYLSQKRVLEAAFVAAAFALGAAGTQIGTAFLLCPEAATTFPYRDALRHARDDATVVTNVFTGRPARALANRLALEVGPISDALPDFPLPMGELAPLRSKAEQQASSEFTPFWSGQAPPLASELPQRRLRRHWRGKQSSA